MARVDPGFSMAIVRRLREASFLGPTEGPCGGTGRRARLKIEFRKECWFDSGQGHQDQNISNINGRLEPDQPLKAAFSDMAAAAVTLLRRPTNRALRRRQRRESRRAATNGRDGFLNSDAPFRWTRQEAAGCPEVRTVDCLPSLRRRARRDFVRRAEARRAEGVERRTQDLAMRSHPRSSRLADRRKIEAGRVVRRPQPSCLRKLAACSSPRTAAPAPATASS